LQRASLTQLWNFTLSLQKASIDLAGIGVQDNPTVDIRASPVHDRGAFNLISAGCVVYASSCLQARVKTGGSICSLFLHNSDLKLMKGARK